MEGDEERGRALSYSCSDNALCVLRLSSPSLCTETENGDILQLPRGTRVILAQLRSGSCRRLNSYLSRINYDISNICPACEETPHDTNHLFTCPLKPIHNPAFPHDSRFYVTGVTRIYIRPRAVKPATFPKLMEDILCCCNNNNNNNNLSFLLVRPSKQHVSWTSRLMISTITIKRQARSRQGSVSCYNNNNNNMATSANL